METTYSWFKLKSVPKIGNYLFKTLINEFKTPDAVFDSSLKRLVHVNGISDRIAHSIRNHKTPDSVKKDFDLVLDNDIRIVTMTDPEYPSLLYEIHDPPPFLYVKGKLTNEIKTISIVGSRKATSYGLSTAKRLSRGLSEIGFNIVSGMAIGIDTAAHKAALEVNGRTVAVLGSGLNIIYPKRNKDLFYQIAEKGAVISEFPVSAEPEAHHFPVRNRIISGISVGTVIVEAAKRSGSLITARLASEQGREVFAVPGSIKSFNSNGTHDLIRQGAKLTGNVTDILEELEYIIGMQPGLTDQNKTDEINKNDETGLSPDESLILSFLEPYPIHMDNIAREAKIESGKLSGLLLQLEIKGLAEQSPGNKYSKK